MRCPRPISLLAVSALTGLGAAAVASLFVVGTADAQPATTHPTQLTVHADKSHPAPKRHDPFAVHLGSRHHGLAGETANLSLWERTVQPSGHRTQWTNVTTDGTVTDNGDGSYAITGVTPNDPTPKSGHKDQFQVRFATDGTYRAAHSSVITVVVKPAS